MTAPEQWRPVVDHPGYEVSDHGNVRSLDRVLPYQRRDQYSGRPLSVRLQRRGQMLRPGAHSSGHLSVALGRGNSRLVHQLVLEAFVGPCPEGCEALHADDQPANNRLSNLSWGTRSANIHDAIRNGRVAVGERRWNAKLKDADIPVIRAQLGRRRIAHIARDYGVCEATIRQIESGRAWRHIPGVAA